MAETSGGKISEVVCSLRPAGRSLFLSVSLAFLWLSLSPSVTVGIHRPRGLSEIYSSALCARNADGDFPRCPRAVLLHRDLLCAIHSPAHTVLVQRRPSKIKATGYAFCVVRRDTARPAHLCVGVDYRRDVVVYTRRSRAVGRHALSPRARSCIAGVGMHPIWLGRTVAAVASLRASGDRVIPPEVAIDSRSVAAKDSE